MAIMAPEGAPPAGPEGQQQLAPEEMEFMERCMMHVMDMGQDQDAAVGICMSELQNMKQQGGAGGQQPGQPAGPQQQPMQPPQQPY